MRGVYYGLGTVTVTTIMRGTTNLTEITSFQSALDNVWNMLGSPLAGIDDQEMMDTRDMCNALNDFVSLDPETGTRGNPVWGNLPRKFKLPYLVLVMPFLSHASMIWDFNLVSMLKLVLWDLILFWVDTCLSTV